MVKRQTTQWSKDRQYNGQKTDNTMVKRQTTQWSKEKGQRTNNGLQNTTQKTKDRAVGIFYCHPTTFHY
jgi:hypothetical protein